MQIFIIEAFKLFNIVIEHVLCLYYAYFEDGKNIL